MQIWLDLAVNVSDGTVNNAQYRPGLRKFYEFKRLTDQQIVDYVPQEKNQKFDYFSSEESDQLKFSASLANEYLPYAWALYKVYGPFEMKIRHDRDEDLAEFGGFIVSPYWGDVYMRVDENEQLTFHVTHRFTHETTREDPRVLEEEILRQDMSFDNQTYNLTCNINEFNGKSDEIELVILEN
jgi:hypothetical protein